MGFNAEDVFSSKPSASLLGRETVSDKQARKLFLAKLGKICSPDRDSTYLRTYSKLILTIIVHGGLIAINSMAVVAMAFYGPWYFSVPMIMMLLSPVLAGNLCALNQYENFLRQQLDMTYTNGFTFRGMYNFFFGDI